MDETPQIVEIMDDREPPRPQPQTRHLPGCLKGCGIFALLLFNLLPLVLSLLAMLVAHELLPLYQEMLKGTPFPPAAANFFATVNYLWLGAIALLIMTLSIARCSAGAFWLMVLDFVLTALLSVFITGFALFGIAAPIIRLCSKLGGA